MGRKYYVDPNTGEKIYIRDKIPSLSKYRKAEEQDNLDETEKVRVDGLITTLSEDIATLESNLETEVSERKSQDEILQGNIDKKQETLISGENIKTVNGKSLLGSGNIVIEGGGGSGVSVTKLTQEEYDLITPSDDVVYMTTDDDDSEIKNIYYGERKYSKSKVLLFDEIFDKDNMVWDNYINVTGYDVDNDLWETDTDLTDITTLPNMTLSIKDYKSYYTYSKTSTYPWLKSSSQEKRYGTITKVDDTHFTFSVKPSTTTFTPSDFCFVNFCFNNKNYKQLNVAKKYDHIEVTVEGANGMFSSYAGGTYDIWYESIYLPNKIQSWFGHSIYDFVKLNIDKTDDGYEIHYSLWSDVVAGYSATRQIINMVNVPIVQNSQSNRWYRYFINNDVLRITQYGTYEYGYGNRVRVYAWND